MEKLIVYPIGKPNLKDEKEMLIGAYWCPIPTEKAYSYVAESGITHMLVNTMIGHEREDKGYYLKPFLLAKKRGVKIVMHCMDKGYNNVKEYAEIFKLQDNFAGVLAKDEPETPDYPFFVEDYKDFKKDFPSLPYYVNLFPIYSSKEQMKAESYEIYLNEYVEKVLKSYRDGDRALMCDCYPLLVENRLHPRWLKNLEMLRAACDQTGADLYLYLQSQGFCEMWRQPKTVRELTFQMYVNMCYGVKGLLHYPYRTPMNTPSEFPASVRYNGRKTYMFELVKEMNEELKAIDGAYLEFKWKAVVKSVGNLSELKNENFENAKDLKDGYGALKGVVSERDAIVGCFTNDEGYQAFLVVNFTEPLDNQNNVVKLKLNGMDGAVVHIKDKKETIKVADGILNLELKSGSGAFVIPFKNK